MGCFDGWLRVFSAFSKIVIKITFMCLLFWKVKLKKLGILSFEIKTVKQIFLIFFFCFNYKKIDPQMLFDQYFWKSTKNHQNYLLKMAKMKSKFFTFSNDFLYGYYFCSLFHAWLNFLYTSTNSIKLFLGMHRINYLLAVRL